MSVPLPVVDIVDDNMDVLRGLGRVLSAHGYRVCMFTSGEQYLSTVAEGKAACVVIDIALRGSVSGLELAKAISSSPRPIPFVFVSASADEALRDEALIMGCLAYLEEPISSDMLISAVRRSSSTWGPVLPGR